MFRNFISKKRMYIVYIVWAVNAATQSPQTTYETAPAGNNGT